MDGVGVMDCVLSEFKGIFDPSNHKYITHIENTALNAYLSIARKGHSNIQR